MHNNYDDNDDINAFNRHLISVLLSCWYWYGVISVSIQSAYSGIQHVLYTSFVLHHIWHVHSLQFVSMYKRLVTCYTAAHTSNAKCFIIVYCLTL